jgi:hypothetical protein
VQFGSLVLIPLGLALFPPRYTGTGDLGAIAWYGLAKLFEYVDGGLYALTGVSGHAWKHLTAAVSAGWIVRTLVRRRPLAPGR